MPQNTNIKFYMFNNTNAPQLSNTWGCLIDILDACLVTGFGSIPVTSLNVDSGICTATFATSHNFKQHQVIEISGADRNEFNTEFRILSVPTANTFTFAVDTSAISAGGSISCSLPPLGWKKEFSGTQKAVYRGNKGLDALYLRVDNSCSPGAPKNGAKFGKITVCDAMSGIDGFGGVQMPFNASSPNRNHAFANNRHGWFKWYHATLKNGTDNNFLESAVPSEGNRDWIIVGDQSFFVLLNRSNMQENSFFTYGFGKVKSILNGSDNYALLVSDAYVTTSGTVWHQIYDPISGGRSDYRANSHVFYDKAGGANYQRIQKFSMPFVANDTTVINGLAQQQYSGGENILDSYDVLGKYVGFDIVGYAQNIPVFYLPFIKSLAQIGAHLSFQNEGFVTFLANYQEGAQPSYLLNLKER
ncbi:hypothetical protein [Acinetobacter ursingii]|uniref:hypothetical protein n=1 Tax=Acinetobacter ursingii TaxID=108980 RepID=UPI00300BA660